MAIAEAKRRFSDVVRLVDEGEEVIVTRGVKKEPVAVVVSIAEWRKAKTRALGTLSHWGPITFSDDWAMTDEELLES